ncbi:skin secretory protein xP2-like [Vidua chalybeata]|uniref:skin secretory protein xP2-like n=1 Tax=Vidua chalybeata TaxID=81927 RepID=UPI0023A7A13B|nr:skin secretory protein xP2-like [Vidua chalybeata]
MDRELSQREDTQETSQREGPGVQEMSRQGARSSQELYQGQSPTEAEPAAAAPAGAAEEEEEPPEAPGAEKAAEPPAPREELPSAGTQSPVPAPARPPGCRQALLDLAWSASCEIVSQALLDIQGCGQQPEEQRHLGESGDAAVAARGRAEREESPVPAPHSPPSPSSAQLGAPATWEEPEWAVAELAESVLAQQGSQESMAWDSDWEFYSEEEEGEVEPELSQGADSVVQELSQGEDDGSSSSGEKPVGPVKEEDTQPCPPEGPSSASPVGTEVAAEAAPALPSASPAPGRENDSDTGLVQENRPEHSSLTKPLYPKDDEWDNVSILELPPEQEEVFAAGGLAVAVPREAWVECPAQEPCSQGPAPAPHSPPSPWPARLRAQALRGQPAAPRKRPSRFRRALRALRGLFRCPCLRPRPEE